MELRGCWYWIGQGNGAPGPCRRHVSAASLQTELRSAGGRRPAELFGDTAVVQLGRWARGSPRRHWVCPAVGVKWDKSRRSIELEIEGRRQIMKS